jgi:hypothetical protein
MVVEKIVTLDRRSLNYNCGIELFLIIFSIVVSIIGFSLWRGASETLVRFSGSKKSFCDRGKPTHRGLPPIADTSGNVDAADFDPYGRSEI